MSSICMSPQYAIATDRSMSDAGWPRYHTWAKSMRSNRKKGPTCMTCVQCSSALSRSGTTKPFCMTGPKLCSMNAPGELSDTCRRGLLVQASRPSNAARQHFVVDRRLPAAALDRWILRHERLHIESAAAVSQGKVQHLPFAMRMQIQHRTRLIREPLPLGKTALRLAVVLCVQQHVVGPMKLRQIQLIVDGERLDASHQRVTRVRHLNEEISERWMRHELASQQPHEARNAP